MTFEEFLDFLDEYWALFALPRIRRVRGAYKNLRL